MEVWFLIVAALVIAWALIRGAGGGKRLGENVAPAGGAERGGAARAEGAFHATGEVQDTGAWWARDPVCGSVGSIAAAATSLEYEGQRFHFCSESCRELFTQQPQRYLPPPHYQGTEHAVRIPSRRSASAAGAQVTMRHVPLDWRTVGITLASFFAITYILCVIFGLLFPQWAMYELWGRLLPGFTWLTVGGFLLGLAASVAYGLYIALLFCPLYNVISRRLRPDSATVSDPGEGI